MIFKIYWYNFNKFYFLSIDKPTNIELTFTSFLLKKTLAFGVFNLSFMGDCVLDNDI